MHRKYWQRCPILIQRKSIIQNVFNVSADVNLKFFVDKSLAGTMKDGYHSGAGDFVYTGKVGINPDVLQNSCKEYILVTFLHEAIHAYIDHNVRLYNSGQIDSATFKKNFLIFWNPNNLGKITSPSELAEHEAMAEQYVIVMANAIKSYNPNISETFAKALAWGGLERTRIYLTKIANGDSIEEMNLIGRNVGYSAPSGTSIPQFSKYSDYNATKCP